MAEYPSNALYIKQVNAPIINIFVTNTDSAIIAAPIASNSYFIAAE
jgi:hypothetical protein